MAAKMNATAQAMPARCAAKARPGRPARVSAREAVKQIGRAVLLYTAWGYKVFSERISAEAINPDEGGLHPSRVRDSSQPEAVIGY